jgi:uncharacterized membrane protein
MIKWFKIMFVSSVVLNIALIIGVIWARNYVRKQSFELAATTAEAEGKLAKHILTKLESDEPDRIEAVKKLLQNSVENSEKAADMWRQAAEK